jgi:hypothetical protein
MEVQRMAGFFLGENREKSSDLVSNKRSCQCWKADEEMGRKDVINYHRESIVLLKSTLPNSSSKKSAKARSTH